MEKSCEIIQKSEVVLNRENLEVTDRVKTIKSLMDAVIGSSIIESTKDVLDYFNRLLNGNWDFVIDLLNQKDLLFEFHIINSVIEAQTSKIDNCRSVPSFVVHLLLNSCDELKSLEGLPDGLEILFIWHCKNLRSLEGLPEGVKSLDIDFCNNLKSLKGLPAGLKSLEISSCKNLKSLEELPVGLKSLEISWCDNLKSLEGLPSDLVSLQIDERSRQNLDKESLKMLEKFWV